MVTSASENATMVYWTRGDEPRQPKQAVTVKLSSIIHAIMDIDNDKQEFTASLTIHARWKEPQLAGMSLYDRIDWNAQWTPRIELENAVCVKSMTQKCELRYFETDQAMGVPYVCQTMKVVATFKELFELEEFPFDYQALNMWLTSERSSDEVRLVKDIDFKDRIVTSSFPESNEWTLQPYVIGDRVSAVEDADSPPYYTFTCHVSRHHRYHLWNHAFVMSILLLLSFGAFAIDLQSVALRLIVSMLMLLIAVAYRGSIQGDLPRTAYWTTMARFSLFNLLLHASIAFESACAGKASQTVIANASSTNYSAISDALSPVYTADYVVTALIFAAACLGHLAFAAQAVLCLSKRRAFLSGEAKAFQSDCAKVDERQFKLRGTSTRRRIQGLVTTGSSVYITPRPSEQRSFKISNPVDSKQREPADGLGDLASQGAAMPGTKNVPMMTAVEMERGFECRGDYQRAGSGIHGFFRPSFDSVIENGHLSPPPPAGSDQVAESVSSRKPYTIRLSAGSAPQPAQRSEEEPKEKRRRSKRRSANRVGSSSGDNESRV